MTNNIINVTHEEMFAYVYYLAYSHVHTHMIMGTNYVNDKVVLLLTLKVIYFV